jgi:hypothetical protein
MRLPAAKGTAQISTIPVSWIGGKKDAAMFAAGQERPQVRFGVQEGPQDEIELQDQAAYPRFTVPVRAELEMFLDFYGKEARVSLMMLMVFFEMPLSYHAASSWSRGRVWQGLFFRASSCPCRPASGPKYNDASDTPRHPRRCMAQLLDNEAAWGQCIVTGTTGRSHGP